MIHQYKAKGFNIVLDIYSGSVHAVDDVTYDIIKDYENKEKNEIEKSIKEKYKLDSDQFEEAYKEVKDLADEALLFTDDIYEGLSIDITKKPTTIKALCLNVAHTCNLSCEYCFAKGGKYSGPDAIMSKEIARSAIDFLLENSGSHYNLDIDFFGGEPLLNFDVVKDTVAYAKSKEEEYKKHFNFTLTTNGLLLDDEVIDYLNENMKNVVLSLDGRKEKHDQFRKTLNGKGSYDAVVPKFQNFVKKRGDKEYYMRGTFTANNLDFTKDLQNYIDLGFTRTSLEPVVGKQDEAYALKDEHLEKIYSEYEKLADMLMEKIDKNEEFIFYHYMIDLENGPCVHKRISGCGSGTEYMAVTPTGELYPCHQFVGNPDFVIGNLKDGIVNKDLVNEFKTCNCYSKEECRACWANMYCSGGCAANSYNATGDINNVYDYSCKLFKKRIEMAIAVKIYEYMKEAQEIHA
ncbi:thioether cross-link-forming SCIFF peptide maturase [Anaerococcus tetradius]|uniref:Six-Cys-in-45 modification radical SAM protein n=1 Tax=Anaerococcus tetradius ATCC 35098 TaxID=525255 RepID=C2CFE9_9FIRM|nr:thioether cross-link-forming SCIFF peptide maturase [Anaerococcus tetradius]EEI83768.1 six-Cys-in-45 modification radical SAM protein [Anaerococcus tetradius ATCC 35098]